MIDENDGLENEANAGGEDVVQPESETGANGGGQGEPDPNADASAAADPAETVDWQARATAAEAALAEVTAERDDLKAKLEAAANAPKVTRGATGRKVRKISATTGARATDAGALLEAIGKAETVEVLFCAGGAELTDPAALTVAGDVWSASQFGLKLKLPELLVTGSGPGATTIEGYALFLDGKQAAYQPRSDALSIPPGATFNLTDDVVFAA